MIFPRLHFSCSEVFPNEYSTQNSLMLEIKYSEMSKSSYNLCWICMLFLLEKNVPFDRIVSDKTSSEYLSSSCLIHCLSGGFPQYPPLWKNTSTVCKGSWTDHDLNFWWTYSWHDSCTWMLCRSKRDGYTIMDRFTNSSTTSPY